MTAPPRYDGLAGWYDAQLGEFAASGTRVLLDFLGPGPGRAVEEPGGEEIPLQLALSATKP